MSTSTLPRHTSFATPRPRGYAASSTILPARRAVATAGSRGARRAGHVRVVVMTLLVALVALVALAVYVVRPTA